MGAAVGAALKKVLVAILTEPKVLKNILFSILVVVVAMILPTVFVVSIFSGDFEVDTASLQQHVEENLSAADVVLLTNVENTMEAIEEAISKRNWGVKPGQPRCCMFWHSATMPASRDLCPGWFPVSGRSRRTPSLSMR